MPRLLIAAFAFTFTSPALAGPADEIPRETPAAAAARHRRVAARRGRTQIICHRGALEFAHENTLEAFRATFELGGDGNEIDIRATRDGVLVCFHDDMLDHLLEAYGDVSDVTWGELRRFRFRRPGPFGAHCRVPRLVEVLQLHREHAGLLFLDVKRPGLAKAILELMERMDMLDHVIQAPRELDDPRLRRGRFKGSLYAGRGEVDEAVIAAILKKPGDAVLVEDPRGVAVALGRAFRRPSREPVSAVVPDTAETRRLAKASRVDELLEILRDASDSRRVATGDAAEARSAEQILGRAVAADQLAALGGRSDEVFRVLEERVRHRSLHRSWRYNGLDGAAALRALVRGKAPRAVEVARFCLWRDDPASEAVADPRFGSPRSWTDWRTKTITFRLLESIPGEETERLCRDYLALTDRRARELGPLEFEGAARTLLAIRPEGRTALELMRHRRGDVRGRAILVCVAAANKPWARKALETAAPHALAYVLP